MIYRRENGVLVPLKDRIIRDSQGNEHIVRKAYNRNGDLIYERQPRTITGQPPFNFFSLGDGLIEFGVKGNTVQSGIPTPSKSN